MNQRVAFAIVGHEDCGVLAAMLSSLATAAETIGTTAAVPVMEINASGDLWTHAAAFAGAQQFGCACVALVGLVGSRCGSKNQAAYNGALAAISLDEFMHALSWFTA